MRISDWSSDVCSSDLGASAAGGGAFLASSALLSLPDPETSDSTPNTIAPARAAPTTIFLLSHWTVLSEGMRFGRSAAGVRSISLTSGVASTSTLLSDTSVLRRALDSFRSEEHTSELQSLMRISYAVFCLKKKKKSTKQI